jgi:hypothetical protein
MRAPLTAAVLAAACCTAIAAAPQAPVSSPVARLLAEARAAIGIGAGDAGPRSLRMTGTRWTSQVVGSDRTGVMRVLEQEHPLQILCVLSDGYLEIARHELFETRRGFRRDRSILQTMPLAPDVQTSTGSPPIDLAPFRRSLARLAAGMLARVDTLPGLVVTAAGPNAVRLDDGMNADPRALAATLEIDPATKLPARLVWRARTRVLQPGAILGNASGAMGAGPVGPDAPEETLTMAFGDRRDVDGYRLPFRITLSTRGITLEEMRFDRIDVNPALTDEDFR